MRSHRCGPCQRIKPVLEDLAAKHPTVTILKVDVDEMQDIAQREQVRSMPTFKSFRDGQQAGTFSGADPRQLAAMVEALL